MSILVTLIIGAIAGWLGSLIFRGSGFGLIGNIVIGILGSFVGYWFLGLLNFSFGGGTLGIILTGAVGAIIILALANIIFGGKR
ncbi:MAG: GlsB/YeaQ/YmgE family stress response membrane protein [Saprospiraceae bacterium]|nr:GlsB/YeaQ/YmgE family stress response membrane protein [Saprospiraceae bacterium]